MKKISTAAAHEMGEICRSETDGGPGSGRSVELTSERGGAGGGVAEFFPESTTPPIV